jgi:hypothetical protein
MTTLTTTRHAARYVAAIKNDEKREYAIEYLTWWTEGGVEPEAPETLSYMAGQAVRMRIRALVPAPAPEPEDDGGWDADAAYERYLEDGGPAADRISAEDDYERQLEAMDPGLSEMRAAREAAIDELVKAGATEATCQGCPRCRNGATYPCPSQTRVWYESRDRRWFPAAR